MSKKNKDKNFVEGRIISFKNAFKGIPYILKERNSIVHIVTAISVVIAAYLLHFQAWEWCVLILCISFILALEGMNTAVEYLVDIVSPVHNELAGKVKDISSGAVLLGAIGTLLVGAILFGRHLI